MDYFEKFEKFIQENKLINYSDRILIAFSGGADSVFLTEFLIKISKNYNLELGLFHLNHLLRGKYSDNDENFSINFAKNHNLHIFTEKFDIKTYSKQNKLSLEEAGRIIRYKLLDEIALKNNFNKIATAHNYDDQIETFFLNIFRGRSIRSFESIRLFYRNIIRPILIFSKKEIILYLRNNNIDFVTDYSNFDKNFLRNKIRLDLLPYMEKIFSDNFKQNIFNLTSQIKELNNFLEHEIVKLFDIAIKAEKNGYRLYISQLPSNNFILVEILKKLFKQLDCYEYNNKILTNLIKFIKDSQGKFIFQNIEFYKEYETVFIQKKILKESSPKLLLTEVSEKIDFHNKSQQIEYVDAEKLNHPLQIRYFKNGDRFMPLGLSSEIKLKDFFINQKIPVRLRKKIPLVIDNQGEIIWVTGYRISEKIKIDSFTKNIIKLEIKNPGN
jgi:tRNA(Ile)-lysidine synthase